MRALRTILASPAPCLRDQSKQDTTLRRSSTRKLSVLASLRTFCRTSIAPNYRQASNCSQSSLTPLQFNRRNSAKTCALRDRRARDRVPCVVTHSSPALRHGTHRGFRLSQHRVPYFYFGISKPICAIFLG